MSETLFPWFEQHPAAYWAGAALSTAALLGLVIAQALRPATAAVSRRSEWAFVGLLRRASQPDRTLFEHRLNPSAVAADRGRQAAEVALGPTQPDDRLVLLIDPAGSDSWDWTYVTDFELR